MRCLFRLVLLGVIAGGFAVHSIGQNPSTVVFLGDSITANWTTLVDILSGTIGFNSGISGNNTLDMLNRFETDVASHNPNTVYLLGGVNDINQGLTEAQSEANITSIIEHAQSHGIRIVLCLLAWDVDGSHGTSLSRIITLNSWLSATASANGLTLVDYYSVTYGHPEYFYDGLHPNSDGYAVMQSALLASH